MRGLRRGYSCVGAGAVSGKMRWWWCGFGTVEMKVAQVVHEQVRGHRARAASVQTSAPWAPGTALSRLDMAHTHSPLTAEPFKLEA